MKSMDKNYFSVEKFTYLRPEQFQEGIDLSFIPPLHKRRLNKIDRIAFYLLNKTFDDSTEAIVFCSRYGEFERLQTIIEQYKSNNEVSPNAFSSSTHNFPVASFCALVGTAIPIYALSGGKDSLINGFMCAYLNEYKKVLYCFASEEEKSFALIINKGKND